MTELKQPRSLYASRMSPEQARLIAEDLKDEDRYDTATEMALYRQAIAAYVSMETQVRENHPGREDMLLAVKAQQAEIINGYVRTLRIAREVDNAGRVHTDEALAALIDKLASLVVYHVLDVRQRDRVLADFNAIAEMYGRQNINGTLLTPDQDAQMMDGTIPFHLE